MPESKGRKKTPYTPPPSKGERKVAKIGSPGWLAPAMIACFVIGLVYIVIYYVAGSQIPIMNSIGGAANRSEERRVGKECQCECRSRWSPYH